MENGEAKEAKILRDVENDDEISSTPLISRKKRTISETLGTTMRKIGRQSDIVWVIALQYLLIVIIYTVFVALINDSLSEKVKFVFAGSTSATVTALLTRNGKYIRNNGGVNERNKQYDEWSRSSIGT